MGANFVSCARKFFEERRRNYIDVLARKFERQSGDCDTSVEFPIESPPPSGTLFWSNELPRSKLRGIKRHS